MRLAFDAQSKRAAIGTDDRRIALLALDPVRLIELPAAQHDELPAFAFSADGLLLHPGNRPIMIATPIAVLTGRWEGKRKNIGARNRNLGNQGVY